MAAEVIFAVRYELARSLTGLLIRRTSMIWRTPPAAIAAAPKVARLMATELGWSAAREESEIAKINKLTPSGDFIVDAPRGLSSSSHSSRAGSCSVPLRSA